MRFPHITAQFLTIGVPCSLAARLLTAAGLALVVAMVPAVLAAEGAVPTAVQVSAETSSLVEQTAGGSNQPDRVSYAPKRASSTRTIEPAPKPGVSMADTFRPTTARMITSTVCGGGYCCTVRIHSSGAMEYYCWKQ
jgi:hypothetical protein